MATRLDHRGWTAAEWVAASVICGRPAILRSPWGRPCHWTCALTWTQQHDQAHDGEQRAAQEPAMRQPFRRDLCLVASITTC